MDTKGVAPETGDATAPRVTSEVLKTERADEAKVIDATTIDATQRTAATTKRLRMKWNRILASVSIDVNWGCVKGTVASEKSQKVVRFPINNQA